MGGLTTGGSPEQGRDATTDLSQRVLVVGCGALGGLLLARLTEAGVNARGLARPGQLSALAAGGVLLQMRGATRQVPVRASDRVSGPVDLVLLATKTAQRDAADRSSF